MVQDPLLPRLFPPDSLEASHTAMLCSRALAEQRAALQAGSLTPPPVRRLQPTLDTPLAVRGVTLVCSRCLGGPVVLLGAPACAAPPGCHLAPSPLPPVPQDKLVDDELLALVHTMRKSLLRSSQRPGSGGGGTATIQIVDLGAQLAEIPCCAALDAQVRT